MSYTVTTERGTARFPNPDEASEYAYTLIKAGCRPRLGIEES